MKSQGTCKILSHCSAHSKAIRNMETNHIIVYYNSTHYNHKAQLGHLRIPNTTRKLIASKLRSGVTTQRIIDDIRDTTQSRQLNREHLVCRKDISNIQKQYNIEGIRRHQNDLISVSSIVEEMDTLPYNPVVVFKQQGDLPTASCRHLKEDDFLLVIQTEFQRDMLSSHGNKGVCMDATYRSNDYDFNLITLMVLDSYEEGIPVAWALSNREDKPVLLTVLYSLKKRCGGVASCWFMSDMAQQYYSAWEEVFGGDNTKYLWCTWHVDRAWRDGLRRYIRERGAQREIYHQLRVLLRETEKAKFTTLLTKFFTLNKENWSAFTEYFHSTYCSHIEQWAMCHRIGTPMNTNMYSEAFHRVLKVVYLRHQHNRRIDYLIYILLKSARDKAFEQLLKREKGKNTHRICDINKRHRNAISYALLATVNDLGNHAYKVSSQSRHGEYFTVQTIEFACTCQTKCQFCSACAHMYSCTCLDACTNTTVCKHMHLVHMQNNQRHTPESKTALGNPQTQTEYLPSSFPVESSSALIMTKIENRLGDIQNQCRTCENTSTLEKVHRLLGTALEQVLCDTNDILTG